MTSVPGRRTGVMQALRQGSKASRCREVDGRKVT
jgi:hypothetical protein